VKKTKGYSMTRSDRKLGMLLIIPIILVIFVIMGIPFVRAVYLSLTNKVIGKQESFIWFDNYKKLFASSTYWKVLRNTVTYTVGSVGTKLVFGMVLALVLNQKFRGRAFFRTVLLVPWALPGMVAAMTWRWMYDSTYGILNSLLLRTGLIDLPMAWLSNPKLTLITVMIVNVWRGVPFFIFSLLGALQTIDGQMYEAAYIDGAGPVRQFFSITLPSISNVTKVTTLLSTIWTFNDFENIQLVTGGGPLYSSSVISTYTYDQAFIQNSFGSALAVAVSVVPILLVFMYFASRGKEEQSV
jgi:ABC-type sugar transport systems, permease components